MFHMLYCNVSYVIHVMFHLLHEMMSIIVFKVLCEFIDVNLVKQLKFG
jgi:hypothetical protein